MQASVVIYTTDYCPYCVRAKQLFSQKKVSFKEVRCDSRDDLRDFIEQASGQRTVPQIFIHGKSYGGFMDVAALDRNGELDKILNAAPPTIVELPE